MVYIEVYLKSPYSVYLDVLIKFCQVYKSRIVSAGSYKRSARFAIPNDKFVKIFHHSPAIKTYDIPSGAEAFTEGNWTVYKID